MDDRVELCRKRVYDEEFERGLDRYWMMVENQNAEKYKAEHPEDFGEDGPVQPWDDTIKYIVWGMKSTNKPRRKKYLAKIELEKIMDLLDAKVDSEPHFTWKEWKEMCIKFGNRCVCCGKSFHLYKLTDDHIIPVMRGGSNAIDNIQPMCLPCNVKKGTKTIDYRQDFFIRFPQFSKN